MNDDDAFPNPEDFVPKIRRDSEMRPGPPRTWIGPGWLPRSEVAVLVGQEGIGKSLLWVKIASHITTGTAFKPFNIPKREPADVLVIATEDSVPAIRERLKLSGTDMSRISWFSIDDDGTGSPVFGHLIDGSDFGHLEQQIKASDEAPAMVVVDAWLDTVSGKLDVRNGQQARQALHPWSTLSARYGFITLLLTHTNRMDTTSARDLMADTSVLSKKARMVLFAARPRNCEEPVVYVGPTKANDTGITNAVRFHIGSEQVREKTDDDPGTSAHLVRPNYTTDTIEGHLVEWKRAEIQESKAPTLADSAVDDIRSFMEDRDSVLTKELTAHLEELGYKKTAIEKAKQAAGRSVPGTKGGPWNFVLHESSVPSLPDVPSLLSDGEDLGTLDSKSPYQSSYTQETSDTRETRDTYEAEPAVDSADTADIAAIPEDADEADEANDEQPPSPQGGVNPYPTAESDDAEVNRDLFGNEVKAKALRHRDQILAYLAEHGSAGRKTIAAGIGRDPNATSSTLTRLKDDGEVERPEEDGPFYITEAGHTALAEATERKAS